MLKPPTSMVADQVPDSEIAKCSPWLEAFAAHSAHSASICSTSLEAVYTFLQKVMFLRSSVAQDSIKNDAMRLDDLLQRANSTVMEAQLRSHDAGVTAAELYLHMLRRRTVLESPSVDLPQRDKDRLLVMSLGGNDLFSPNARKVQEWKRDKEEEKVKMISRVFEERENREKAARKKTSSSVRPPRGGWGGGGVGGWGVGGDGGVWGWVGGGGGWWGGGGGVGMVGGGVWGWGGVGGGGGFLFTSHVG